MIHKLVKVRGADFCDDQFPIISTIGRGPKGEQGEQGDTLKFADSIEWNSQNAYETLTVVLYQGDSYISKQAVPAGIDISDEEYWVHVGDFNAQLELYRQEAAQALQVAQDAEQDIDNLTDIIPASSFSTENTVEDFVKKCMVNDVTASPVYYGADPTGTEDSSSAIQACLDENINSTVVFPQGIYRIDNPIEIDFAWTRGLIDFNGSTLINNVQNDFAFGVGTKNVNLDGEGDHGKETLFIKNFTLESVSTYAISVERWFMNCHLESFSILTTKNGIRLGMSHEGYANKPIDALVNDFMIYGKSPVENGFYGIEIIGTDAKITNGRIYGFKHCIQGNGYLTQIHNIHFLLINVLDWPATIDTNYCCVYNPGALHATECYCDTYPCFARGKNGSPMSISVANLYVYSYHALYYGTIFDFTEYALNSSLGNSGITSITGLSFYPENYPTDAKIIDIPSIPIGTNPGTFFKGFLRESNIEYDCKYNLSYYDFAKPRDDYSPKYWPAFKSAGSMVMVGTIYAPSNSIDLLTIENNNGKFVFELNINTAGELTDLKYVDAISQKRFSTSSPRLGLLRVGNSRMYEVYFTDDAFSVNTNLHVSYVSTMNHIFAPVNHEADAIISTETMTYTSTNA